jgi:hypothetical protein
MACLALVEGFILSMFLLQLFESKVKPIRVNRRS